MLPTGTSRASATSAYEGGGDAISTRSRRRRRDQYAQQAAAAVRQFLEHLPELWSPRAAAATSGGTSMRT
ncbi:hypothetical protein [Lentzea nigeriaca]|uniref:hypothetical protein n=1 Tax=Lentzea nigeriaca TaxID=1128665 RepID=UPI001957526F|nr:hypothetical protein [Lentzea nigeriaca]MBM7862443.1 hypothetical protein [Lentzea nigeriaca]